MNFLRRTPADPVVDAQDVRNASNALADIATHLEQVSKNSALANDANTAAVNELARLSLARLGSIDNAIRALKAQPLSEQPEPWPDDVVARYLTVVGGHVDITDVSEPYHDGAQLKAICYGCGWDSPTFDGETYLGSRPNRDRALNETGSYAQAHADKCRALAKPAVIVETGVRS